MSEQLQNTDHEADAVEVTSTNSYNAIKQSSGVDTKNIERNNHRLTVDSAQSINVVDKSDTDDSLFASDSSDGVLIEERPDSATGKERLKQTRETIMESLAQSFASINTNYEPSTNKPNEIADDRARKNEAILFDEFDRLSVEKDIQKLRTVCPMRRIPSDSAFDGLIGSASAENMTVINQSEKRVPSKSQSSPEACTPLSFVSQSATAGEPELPKNNFHFRSKSATSFSEDFSKKLEMSQASSVRSESYTEPQSNVSEANGDNTDQVKFNRSPALEEPGALQISTEETNSTCANQAKLDSGSRATRSGIPILKVNKAAKLNYLRANSDLDSSHSESCVLPCPEEKSTLPRKSTKRSRSFSSKDIVMIRSTPSERNRKKDAGGVSYALKHHLKKNSADPRSTTVQRDRQRPGRSRASSRSVSPVSGHSGSDLRLHRETSGMTAKSGLSSDSVGHIRRNGSKIPQLVRSSSQVSHSPENEYAENNSVSPDISSNNYQSNPEKRFLKEPFQSHSHTPLSDPGQTSMPFSPSAAFLPKMIYGRLGGMIPNTHHLTDPQQATEKVTMKFGIITTDDGSVRSFPIASQTQDSHGLPISLIVRGARDTPSFPVIKGQESPYSPVRDDQGFSTLLETDGQRSSTSPIRDGQGSPTSPTRVVRGFPTLQARDGQEFPTLLVREGEGFPVSQMKDGQGHHSSPMKSTQEFPTSQMRDVQEVPISPVRDVHGYPIPSVRKRQGSSLSPESGGQESTISPASDGQGFISSARNNQGFSVFRERGGSGFPTSPKNDDKKLSFLPVMNRPECPCPSARYSREFPVLPSKESQEFPTSSVAGSYKFTNVLTLNGHGFSLSQDVEGQGNPISPTRNSQGTPFSASQDNLGLTIPSGMDDQVFFNSIAKDEEAGLITLGRGGHEFPASPAKEGQEAASISQNMDDQGFFTSALEDKQEFPILFSKDSQTVPISLARGGQGFQIPPVRYGRKFPVSSARGDQGFPASSERDRQEFPTSRDGQGYPNSAVIENKRINVSPVTDVQNEESGFGMEDLLRSVLETSGAVPEATSGRPHTTSPVGDLMVSADLPPESASIPSRLPDLDDAAATQPVTSGAPRRVPPTPPPRRVFDKTQTIPDDCCCVADNIQISDVSDVPENSRQMFSREPRQNTTKIRKGTQEVDTLNITATESVTPPFSQTVTSHIDNIRNLPNTFRRSPTFTHHTVGPDKPAVMSSDCHQGITKDVYPVTSPDGRSLVSSEGQLMTEMQTVSLTLYTIPPGFSMPFLESGFPQSTEKVTRDISENKKHRNQSKEKSKDEREKDILKNYQEKYRPKEHEKKESCESLKYLSLSGQSRSQSVSPERGRIPLPRSRLPVPQRRLSSEYAGCNLRPSRSPSPKKASSSTLHVRSEQQRPPTPDSPCSACSSASPPKTPRSALSARARDARSTSPVRMNRAAIMKELHTKRARSTSPTQVLTTPNNSQRSASPNKRTFSNISVTLATTKNVNVQASDPIQLASQSMKCSTGTKNNQNQNCDQCSKQTELDNIAAQRASSLAAYVKLASILSNTNSIDTIPAKQSSRGNRPDNVTNSSSTPISSERFLSKLLAINSRVNKPPDDQNINARPSSPSREISSKLKTDDSPAINSDSSFHSLFSPLRSRTPSPEKNECQNLKLEMNRRSSDKQHVRTGITEMKVQPGPRGRDRKYLGEDNCYSLDSNTELFSSDVEKGFIETEEAARMMDEMINMLEHQHKAFANSTQEISERLDQEKSKKRHLNAAKLVLKDIAKDVEFNKTNADISQKGAKGSISTILEKSAPDMLYKRKEREQSHNFKDSEENSDAVKQHIMQPLISPQSVSQAPSLSKSHLKGKVESETESEEFKASTLMKKATYKESKDNKTSEASRMETILNVVNTHLADKSNQGRNQASKFTEKAPVSKSVNTNHAGNNNCICSDYYDDKENITENETLSTNLILKYRSGDSNGNTHSSVGESASESEYCNDTDKQNSAYYCDTSGEKHDWKEHFPEDEIKNKHNESKFPETSLDQVGLKTQLHNISSNQKETKSEDSLENGWKTMIDKLEDMQREVQLCRQQSAEQLAALKQEVPFPNNEAEMDKIKIKDHYQQEMEKIIQQKVTEFQSKVSQLETIVRSQIHTYTKSMQKKFREKLSAFSKQQKDVISRMEEEHSKELDRFTRQYPVEMERLQQCLVECRQEIMDKKERLEEQENRMNKVLRVIKLLIREGNAMKGNHDGQRNENTVEIAKQILACLGLDLEDIVSPRSCDQDPTERSRLRKNEAKIKENVESCATFRSLQESPRFGPAVHAEHARSAPPIPPRRHIPQHSIQQNMKVDLMTYDRSMSHALYSSPSDAISSRDHEARPTVLRQQNATYIRFGDEIVRGKSGDPMLKFPGVSAKHFSTVSDLSGKSESSTIDGKFPAAPGHTPPTTSKDTSTSTGGSALTVHEPSQRTALYTSGTAQPKETKTFAEKGTGSAGSLVRDPTFLLMINALMTWEASGVCQCDRLKRAMEAYNRLSNAHANIDGWKGPGTSERRVLTRSSSETSIQRLACSYFHATRGTDIFQTRRHHFSEVTTTKEAVIPEKSPSRTSSLTQSSSKPSSEVNHLLTKILRNNKDPLAIADGGRFSSPFSMKLLPAHKARGSTAKFTVRMPIKERDERTGKEDRNDACLQIYQDKNGEVVAFVSSQSPETKGPQLSHENRGKTKNRAKASTSPNRRKASPRKLRMPSLERVHSQEQNKPIDAVSYKFKIKDHLAPPCNYRPEQHYQQIASKRLSGKEMHSPSPRERKSSPRRSAEKFQNSRVEQQQVSKSPNIKHIPYLSPRERKLFTLRNQLPEERKARLPEEIRSPPSPDSVPHQSPLLPDVATRIFQGFSVPHGRPPRRTTTGPDRSCDARRPDQSWQDDEPCGSTGPARARAGSVGTCDASCPPEDIGNDTWQSLDLPTVSRALPSPGNRDCCRRRQAVSAEAEEHQETLEQSYASPDQEDPKECRRRRRSQKQAEMLERIDRLLNIASGSETDLEDKRQIEQRRPEYRLEHSQQRLGRLERLLKPLEQHQEPSEQRQEPLERRMERSQRRLERSERRLERSERRLERLRSEGHRARHSSAPVGSRGRPSRESDPSDERGREQHSIGNGKLEGDGDEDASASFCRSVRPLQRLTLSLERMPSRHECSAGRSRQRTADAKTGLADAKTSQRLARERNRRSRAVEAGARKSSLSQSRQRRAWLGEGRRRSRDPGQLVIVAKSPRMDHEPSRSHTSSQSRSRQNAARVDGLDVEQWVNQWEKRLHLDRGRQQKTLHHHRRPI